MWDGPVAEWLTHLTPNQKISGSNPLWVSSYAKILLLILRFWSKASSDLVAPKRAVVFCRGLILVFRGFAAADCFLPIFFFTAPALHF